MTSTSPSRWRTRIDPCWGDQPPLRSANGPGEQEAVFAGLPALSPGPNFLI
jgi:hypothetical protein